MPASLALPASLNFKKPLVPTAISQRNPPATSSPYLQDLYFPPLFPSPASAKLEPEPSLNLVDGVAFFMTHEHCIGATKTFQQARTDYTKALDKLKTMQGGSAQKAFSCELADSTHQEIEMALKDPKNSLKALKKVIKTLESQNRTNKVISRLAKNRAQRLRFRRATHEDPILQRVAGTISEDGSAKLLVARYHEHSLDPAQFLLLCDKELFGKSCNLGKDFPKKIQYRVFDLDIPEVRDILDEHLFCNNSRHKPHIQTFEPFFWSKEKRAKIIGECIKKQPDHNPH